MQCPECSYISFKIKKACGACGHKFKKNHKGSPLSKKEFFSIFSTLPAIEKQKTRGEEKDDSVDIFEVPEPGFFINSATGDFKLDLPKIEDNKIQEVQTPSDSSKKISEYEPLDFDPNADIDLGEIEVTGLGLELFQTTEEKKIEETQNAETEPAAIKEPKSSEQIPYLEPALGITEPEEEPAISPEPVLEISEPEGEPVSR